MAMSPRGGAHLQPVLPREKWCPFFFCLFDNGEGGEGHTERAYGTTLTSRPPLAAWSCSSRRHDLDGVFITVLPVMNVLLSRDCPCPCHCGVGHGLLKRQAAHTTVLISRSRLTPCRKAL